jgi:betaine-aldehyde dehydrogenase
LSATATTSPLADHYELLIGGEAVGAASGAEAPTINPATEEPLALVAEASAPDVDRAVTAAADAARIWRNEPWPKRAAAVFDLAQRLADEAETFATIDALDAGIPIRGARRDVANAVSYLRYFAGLASELKGHTIESPAGELDLTLREPFGVVGRIVPFNHPLQFAAAAVAAPLIAGNAVVLKPAAQTPISTLHLAALAADLLPAGTLNVVTGGADAGSALVRHSKVGRIGFTGSVATGKAVLRDAAEQVKTVTLELGGKNPLIVFPDVEPGQAADLALVGMNLQRTAGQSCGSTSRVFVHEALYDEFAELLVERIEQLTVGDPLDEATDVGPLAFRAHRDRVRGFIAGAGSEGARLLTGGPDPPAALPQGYFVQPTVFSDVTDQMTIATEEIFGPVVSLLSWSDEDEVITRANSLPLGLTANVATADLSTAIRVARELEAGYVWVNGRGQRPLGAPFGGFKLSGLGEENSLEELLSYTRKKNLFLAGIS